MAPSTPSSVFFLLFHLFQLIIIIHSSDPKCPEFFNCGNLGSLEFPFTNQTQSECGLFKVDCTSLYPRIRFQNTRKRYHVLEKPSGHKLRILDPWLQEQLNRRSCLSLRNPSLPNSPSITSFSFISQNLTLITCPNHVIDRRSSVLSYFEQYRNYTGCGLGKDLSFTVYYKYPPENQSSLPPPTGCVVNQMPIQSNRNSTGIFDLLTAEFTVEWNVSDDCLSCHERGGLCISNNGRFHCERGKDKNRLILALAISGGVLLILSFVGFIIYYRKKRKNVAYLLSRNLSSDPSLKSEVETGSFYFGIHIFSYVELEEATNNFDPSKELGDGGFGTVYHGKLRDGREVAIKRLYEHNCKRVEQFLNEIRILTCLRHPNLVLLYGCTSRKSRELLIVYEYICNGTVADHLHGERATDALLTWPVRMNIAIETASALAYLHNSDIIHRDVKTNNILLDENFCVKVADFGLSRLFPNDVTHVSTAPQGTPGYVDPEYHQCYQLTEKSDVYSFGVVLIELISSMPAVDISRHRHEINLANLAMNRIQRCAFDELIDSTLGYKTDPEVTRMTTSVAEIAFQCLQLDKDSRPSMDEVLEFLKGIQGGEKIEKMRKIDDGKLPLSPETDDVILLKNKNYKSSPNAVTDIWISGSSTTTTSSIG